MTRSKKRCQIGARKSIIIQTMRLGTQPKLSVYGPSFLALHIRTTLQSGPKLIQWGNVSAPGIFCDPCPTGGLLPLICWATLYGFAPWPPGHQQMF